LKEKYEYAQLFIADYIDNGKPTKKIKFNQESKITGKDF
jgi:hypothetical protein